MNLLDPAGRLLPVPAAQQITNLGTVIGIRNAAGYRAYNLDTRGVSLVFAEAFNSLAAGERFYSCGHGSFDDSGNKGGVIVLDRGFSFDGFRSMNHANGTDASGHSPYDGLLRALPGPVNATLHHCFSGRDPDGNDRKVAVSVTLADRGNVTVVRSHKARAKLSVGLSTDPFPNSFNPKALRAVRALQDNFDSSTTVLADHFQEAQRIINAALPTDPPGTIVPHLTYADTGIGGDPPGDAFLCSAPASPIVASTFVVNSTLDAEDGSSGDGFCDTGSVSRGLTGICTLRAALREADDTPETDFIRFNIPGSGIPVIRPEINRTKGPLGATFPVIIDGSTQPSRLVELDGSLTSPPSDAFDPDPVGLHLSGTKSVVRGLVINRFASHGILLRPSGAPVIGDNLIEGNFIGTDSAGTSARPNRGDGVHIVDMPANVIVNNTISSNDGHGIAIDESTFGEATENQVAENRIGVSVAGTALANAKSGVFLTGSVDDTLIAQNVIAFNAESGVRLEPDTGTGNGVRFNSVVANGGLGIDLGNSGVTTNDPMDSDVGANELQNFPVLTTASFAIDTLTVEGTLEGAASGRFAIEFFLNSSCSALQAAEGETYLATIEIAADSTGTANFAVPVPLEIALTSGQFLTATATDDRGNTSEFAACVAIDTGPSNQPPIARAGSDQTVNVGMLVTLDATASSDPDGGPGALAFAWTQTAGPVVTLSDTESATPTFVATEAGVYTFSLVVSDGQSASAPDEVTIAVVSVPVCATDISADMQIARGAFRFNRLTARYVQQVTLANAGASSIAGPVALVLLNLSTNATLANGTGVTTCVTPAGEPFVGVGLGPDDVLSAGETVSILLEFANSANAPILYQTKVVSGSPR